MALYSVYRFSVSISISGYKYNIVYLLYMQGGMQVFLKGEGSNLGLHAKSGWSNFGANFKKPTS